MKHNKTQHIKYFLSLVTLLIFGQSAQGYVPPSFYIIKNLAKKHEKTDSVLFKSKVTFFRKSGDISKIFTENFYFSSKGYAITQFLDEQMNAIKVSDSGVKFTRKWTGNKDLDSKRPLFYDLLYVKDYNSMFAHFKELGMSLLSENDLYNTRKPLPEKTSQPKDAVKSNEIVEGKEPKETLDIQAPNVYESEPYITLSRFENKLAFVVGNADPQIQGLQLWVEKDSLFPLRTILQPIEYRTQGYQLYKNILFPRLIQIYKDGVLWAKIEALEIKENIADNQINPIFNIKNTVSADGESQDYFDLYFKYVR